MRKLHCTIHKDREAERCETCGVNLCNDCMLVHGKIAVYHQLAGEDRVILAIAELREL